MSIHKRFDLLTIVVILSISGTHLSAQDSHYWNLQYGTRSTLLGGAVIGSVSDMAATYYNPAALALFPNPEILLSGKVYQVNTLNLKGGADEGIDLSSSQVDAAPSLFAGSFTFKWLKDHKLSYSILTRQQMKYGIEGRRGIMRDITSGQELVGRELTADQNLSDLWFGISWAYAWNSKIAVGITQYLAVRDQKARNQFLVQSLNPAGNVAMATLIRQFDYKNFRTLWKGGMGINLDPLTLGITITTPSLNLTGSGSALLNAAASDVDLDGDGTEDQLFAANYQQDVSSTYHTPFSIGGGLSYKWGKTRVHASAEWFDAVQKFRVLETSNFEAQSSGESLENRVDHELKSIINYGIGIEINFKEKLNGYTSFVTDYSAAVPETRTNLAISFWDIYHLAAGLAFTLGRSEFTLGVNYAFGSDNLKRSLAFPEFSVSENLEDFLQNAELSYRRLKFLIGFSFQI
ncbi:MAG: hypothetical protein JSW33_14070 [bacterium]|nr:MAG: hypothetical protein JSW33_14070 [bacterium]